MQRHGKIEAWEAGGAGKIECSKWGEMRLENVRELVYSSFGKAGRGAEMPIEQVLVVVGLVPALVNVVLHILMRAKDTERAGIVCMPKLFFWIGSICGVLCLAVMIISVVFGFGMVWNVVGGSAGLLSIVFVLTYYSIYICYDQDTFMYRKLFIRKIGKYSEIKGVIPGANSDYTLVLKKGKMRVDGMAVGGGQFLSYAEERHLEAGLGPIPDIPNVLFRGNVVDPVPKVVLMCLPGVALAVLAIWSAVEWCFTEIPCNSADGTGVLICCAVAICYWSFVWFACYILNHAEKHPRLVALLVKKEELNI